MRFFCARSTRNNPLPHESKSMRNLSSVPLLAIPVAGRPTGPITLTHIPSKARVQIPPLPAGWAGYPTPDGALKRPGQLFSAARQNYGFCELVFALPDVGVSTIKMHEQMVLGMIVKTREENRDGLTKAEILDAQANINGATVATPRVVIVTRTARGVGAVQTVSLLELSSNLVVAVVVKSAFMKSGLMLPSANMLSQPSIASMGLELQAFVAETTNFVDGMQYFRPPDPDTPPTVAETSQVAA